MNRRHFLHASAAALASTALQPLFGQNPSAPSKPLKMAVNLGMIKGAADATIADRFKMARDAGFQGVELNLPDDKLDPEIIHKALIESGL